MAVKITKQQLDWVEDYFLELYGDKSFYPGFYSPHEGMSQLYAKELWIPIFAEFPTIARRDFERLLNNRTLRVIDLADHLWKTNSKSIKWCLNHLEFEKTDRESFGFLMNSFLSSFSALRLPFSSVEKSIGLFLKVAPKWVSTPPIKKGPFVIKHCIFPHPESPLAVQVLNEQGKALLSFGGALCYDTEGKIGIRITNIQGKRLRGSPTLKEKRMHAAQYPRLDNELKMSWRDYFLNETIKLADRMKLSLTGELPRRFGFFGAPSTTDKEWHRQRKNVMRTYLNAGMKRKGQLFVRVPKK